MTTIMTTTVGIREFKMHAPRLIEQAARGERILITRYGKPRAQLEPVREDSTQAQVAPRTVAWQIEKETFDHMSPRLLRAHHGKHVAIHGGKIVDADADHEVLYQRVWRTLGGQVFFIGRVGGPPALIDMPGFETE